MSPALRRNAVRDLPTWSESQLAALLGVSERRVREIRAQILSERASARLDALQWEATADALGLERVG